jgi:hypothetical protein
MDSLRSIFAAHPNPVSDAGEEAFALVTAAAACSYICTACADACLEESAPAEQRKCIRLNLDCADITAVTARLISRAGEQDRAALRAQLETCAKSCRACAQECDRHAEWMEHCRVCAESCRHCADACDAMSKALVA